MPATYKCAVADCTNNTRTRKERGGHLSFHRFPKNPKISKIWVAKCKRSDKFNVMNASICSDHFVESDFERDLMNELLNLPTRKILKPDTIPTIFQSRNNRIETASNKNREERRKKRESKEIVERLLSAPSIQYQFLQAVEKTTNLQPIHQNIQEHGTGESSPGPYMRPSEIQKPNPEPEVRKETPVPCAFCSNTEDLMPKEKRDEGFRNRIKVLCEVLKVRCGEFLEEFLSLSICSDCNELIRSIFQLYQTVKSFESKLNLKAQDIIKHLKRDYCYEKLGDEDEVDLKELTQSTLKFRERFKQAIGAEIYDPGIEVEKNDGNNKVRIDHYYSLRPDVKIPEGAAIRDCYVHLKRLPVPVEGKVDKRPKDWKNESPEKVHEKIVKPKIRRPEHVEPSNKPLTLTLTNVDEICEGGIEIKEESSDFEESSDEDETGFEDYPTISNSHGSLETVSEVTTGKMDDTGDDAGIPTEVSSALKNYYHPILGGEKPTVIQNPFVCMFKGCGQVYSKRSELSQHNYSHNGWYPFSCPKCRTGFYTQRQLRQHANVQGNCDKAPSIVCETCGKSFLRKLTLLVHRIRDHNVQGEFVCDDETCDRSFATRKALRDHRYFHLGKFPFPCDQCKAGFTTPSGLKVHTQRRHSKTKTKSTFNFICEVCGKALKNSHALRSHLRSHSEERPFPCTKCPWAFKSNQKLQNHIQSIHSGTRPYLCQECGSDFKLLYSLKIHQKRHAQKRPFRPIKLKIRTRPKIYPYADAKSE